MNQELPIRFCEPEQVTPDTWVVRQLAGEGMGPVATYINSSVILGEEPVIVDCGPAVTRDEWLETTFSIVDPADVRWIYLSHDDVDHTGNLLQVLDACPDATLVTTAFMMERMSAEFGMALPLPRMRWVNDGDRIDAGDRELVAVTPPTFDSPTTRGVFDTTSGVYWASDAMGSPVPHDVGDIAELDPGFWREGFLGQQMLLSPWLNWTSPDRYDRVVERVRSLGASVVTSAHGPALRGSQIESACQLLRELPYLPPATLPGQMEASMAIVSMVVPPAVGRQGAVDAVRLGVAGDEVLVLRVAVLLLPACGHGQVGDAVLPRPLTGPSHLVGTVLVLVPLGGPLSVACRSWWWRLPSVLSEGLLVSLPLLDEQAASVATVRAAMAASVGMRWRRWCTRSADAGSGGGQVAQLAVAVVGPARSAEHEAQPVLPVV